MRLLQITVTVPRISIITSTLQQLQNRKRLFLPRLMTPNVQWIAARRAI